MKALQATGYDGPLSLEIFNDQFRAGSAAQRRASTAQRSLCSLLEDRPTRPRPPAARRHAKASAPFIEFAVDEPTRPRTSARCCTGSVSARPACHSPRRSSAGRRARSISSSTPKRTASPIRTTSRMAPGSARSASTWPTSAGRWRGPKPYATDPFRQKVGHGELAIPAIRGVGGSLLYFIDAQRRARRGLGPRVHARRRFRARRRSHPRRPHRPVDALRRNAVVAAFLRGRFSIFERMPEQDIADPAGLVKSQALANTDDSVRIVLNGSQSARTLVGALPVGILRLGRAARRLRHRRHFRRGGGDARATA